MVQCYIIFSILKKKLYHTLFLIIQNAILKQMVTIVFDNNKNKNIINIYFKIVKQLRDEVFPLIDEFEDHNLVFADNFTRFRFVKNDNVIDYDGNDDYDDDDDDDDDIDFSRFKFRTDDNLLDNKKSDILVCVISLSSVIKKENIHYPIFKLQKCFYENF